MPLEAAARAASSKYKGKHLIEKALSCDTAAALKKEVGQTQLLVGKN